MARLPFGLLIALLPFIYNYGAWRAENNLMLGLKISIVYGLTIPVTVWLCYGIVYGIKTHIETRLKIESMELPVHFHISVNVLGLMAGIWLALTINHFLFSVPMHGGAFFSSLIFGGIIVIILSLIQAHSKAQEQAPAYRAEAAEARYHILERQMHPHFLFNALNSLAELIESGKENAASTAFNLSDLYRHILANSNARTNPLQSEIEIVRKYLELERLRFGDRLSFSFDVNADPAGVYVPSLVLQTLVENAIKHGISTSVDGGSIMISVHPKSRGGYKLSVINTGTPLDHQNSYMTSDGIGLRNTRARLGLLYGDESALKLTREGERTIASIDFSGENLD